MRCNEFRTFAMDNICFYQIMSYKKLPIMKIYLKEKKKQFLENCKIFIEAYTWFNNNFGKKIWMSCKLTRSSYKQTWSWFD